MPQTQASLFQSFRNGNLTPQEFAVMVAILGLANGQRNVTASATEISEALYGNLSRHAVARAIRNLQSDGWLSWKTSGINRTSTIVVN